MISTVNVRAAAPRSFFALVLANLAVFGLALVAADEVVSQEPPPIAFSSQTITSRYYPTQLEFGPDGRLYVAEVEGLIYAFTIERDDGTGDYSITATEVIDLIQTIPNHNDDGTPFSSDLRNMTGMITAGTADNPVLYVSSSDPRIDDPDADTNSGILSRLTWTGTEWTKLDLVRSLPRSAHDHLPNGLALDADNGILYLAQGGHTNMGAPSDSFEYLPEYALSAAILSIDLNAIGDQTYDIPTLKGEVFGGQAGDNQAMIVPGGPVQVHSPGYRNAYDVLLTTAGRLYTFDNDSNAGWGGPPVGEGPGGTCTNQSNELDSATYDDNLHLITGPGYYGGHPNPTRANRSNTFDGLSPIPEGLANPGECDHLTPGVEDGALAVNSASTNGLAEYTASNFDGQLTGNILATAYDGKVLRLSLNSSGDQVLEQNDLFTSLAGPLGITAQGDGEPFPGTIWVGQFFDGNITVFEPQDFFECDPETLDPDDTSPNGYTYGDLIDNGLDPCNPAQVPPDFDQNFVSDLNDPDIDGDGIANEVDLFDFDADNGRGNPLPHRVAWSSDVVGTLGGMATYNAPGFTGLMAHPDTPVSVFDQFNADHLIPGGAAGIFTVEVVTPGDAQLNTQENAFHFGVDVDGGSGIFTAQARIMTPFAGAPPQNNQSMGLLIGKGDQDNYLKLVTNANGGDGGLLFASEIEGIFDSEQFSAAILGADYVDLFLVIDPAASTVAASYRIASNGTPGPRTAAGRPVAMPADWLSDAINGPAIGIISTSSGADSFPASWSFVEVYAGTGDDFPVPGELDADPPALAFPETLLGDTAVLTVTLSNSGETALEISDAVMTGDSVFANDLALPQILEPGATHDFSVSFTPDVANSFEALLTLSHDGGNSPLQITVTGEGFSPPGELEADPPALDFPATLLGETAVLAVTLSNSGETALEISDAVMTGDSVFANDLVLPQILEPGATHDFSVSFTPDIANSFDALLTLSHDGGNSPLQVPMSGEGLSPPGELNADPPALAFPETLLGDTAFLTVTLSNSGETALEISDAAITGDQVFAHDLALPQTLEPGATHDFSASFTPDVATGFEALLTLSHDGGNSPLQVSMTGVGAEPGTAPVPDPGQVDFGGLVAGSASAPELINVTNTGPVPVTLGNLGISGGEAGDFNLAAATDGCSGEQLGSGEDCTFAVQFQPTQTGVRGAQVDIPSDTGNAAVSLQGQGLIALDLNIDAGPDPAVAGEPLDYTLAVGNLADAQAQNIALAITLPPNTVLLAIDGCLQDSPGLPACTIGQIPANGSIEVIVTVDVSSSATGALQFGVSANAENLDEALSDEITTAVTIVTDLALVVAGDAVPIGAETMSVMYVIIVTNAGPSDAVSAPVMTELAPGLENIEWTCQADATASCTASGVGEIDDLADLPAGTSVTYQIEATASSELIDEGVSSSVEVAAPGGATDPNLENNSDTISVVNRIFHDGFEAIEE